MLDDDLRGRIESFDAAAAAHSAVIVVGREKAGHPIGAADAQIAATRGGSPIHPGDS
jgi:toxin FitB